MRSRGLMRAFAVGALVAVSLAGWGELRAQTTGGGTEAPPAPGDIPGLLASEEGRDAAVRGIRTRAAELQGPDATRWVQLLAVVRRTAPPSGALAARAVLRADVGDAEGGAALVEDALGEVPEEDRAALLAFAGHLAEREDPARAARLRVRLIELEPDAPEAVEARLRLARYRVSTGDRPGAIELLEALIVAAPDHPVAPEARRLLREIGGRTG